MDFIDNDLSKDEILNTYFTSIGTDLIDNNKLQDFCIGNKARQYARFIINEYGCTKFKYVMSITSGYIFYGATVTRS